MSLIQRIKEATAIIGITAILNTNNGCMTVLGTAGGTVTGPIDGAKLAYEKHPALVPVGIAGGLIVGPLTGMAYGITGDLLFGLGGIPDEYFTKFGEAVGDPVCNLAKRTGVFEGKHYTDK